MTFLPVVDRELRALARRRGTYLARLVVAMIAVGLAQLVLMFSFNARSNYGTGGGLFRTIAVVGFGFCLLAGVFLTADCLSEEKREGTLGFLFLSDLRGYDVVLGKLLATSLSAFYAVFAAFPVLAITLTLGGVTPGEFWRMALVFLNTLFFSLAAGVFISSISRQDNRAMTATFALVAFIAGVLPMMQIVLGAFKLAPGDTISLLSPVTAWRLSFDIPYRMGGGTFWKSIQATHLFSWFLLILASVLLPRLWQERPGLVPAFTHRRLDSNAVSPRRVARRAAMLDMNPVYWLASRGHAGFGGAWAALGIFLLGGWSLNQRNPILQGVGALFAVSILPLLLRVLIGLYACRFFVGLRRNGAMELLLSTPLTVKQILGGQWLFLRRLFLLPVLAVLGLQLLLVALAWSGSFAGWPFGFPLPSFPRPGAWSFLSFLYGMPSFVPDVFTAAWIGMMVGLTSKKIALVPGLTLLYIIVLPTLLFCVPNVFIDIPVIFWARDKLYRQLRALGSARYAPTVVERHSLGDNLVLSRRS